MKRLKKMMHKIKTKSRQPKTPVFKVNDMVEITGHHFDHRYEIGEQVMITESWPQAGDYGVYLTQPYFNFISGKDAKLVVKTPRRPKPKKK